MAAERPRRASDPVEVRVLPLPAVLRQKHENSDTFLQGASSLEGLLTGTASTSRSAATPTSTSATNPTPAGLVTYVTGGGGATPQTVGGGPCMAIDAYGIGWSNSTARERLRSGAPSAVQRPGVPLPQGHGQRHEVTVTPINSLGQRFDVQTFTFDSGGPPPDSQPPTVPGGVSATAVSSSQVNVAWSASTDNVGVTGYDVLRDGNIVGSVSGSTLTFADTTVAASTTYSYQVRAGDAAGNHSNPSTGVNVTTPAAPGPVTVSLVASEDTYADQQVPTTNFGNATNVFADTSPLQRGFLKFAATGITGTVQRQRWSACSSPTAPPTHRSWRRPRAPGWSRHVTWNSQPAAETRRRRPRQHGHEHVHRLSRDTRRHRQRDLQLRAPPPVEQRPRRRVQRGDEHRQPSSAPASPSWPRRPTARLRARPR